MRDRAVGHQHQIQVRDRRRGVGEVADRRRQIDDRRARRQRLQLGLGRPLLQAIELDIRQRKPLQEEAQGHGAVVVGTKGGAARPHDANLELAAAALEWGGELGQACGVGREIG